MAGEQKATKQDLEPVIPDQHSPTVPDPNLEMGDWTRELRDPYGNEVGGPRSPSPDGQHPTQKFPNTGRSDTRPEAAGPNPPSVTPPHSANAQRFHTDPTD